MTTDDMKRFNALDENQKLDYSGHGLPNDSKQLLMERGNNGKNC